jgi:glycosyltransferase involved in cell wall biosynthesis
MILDSAVDRLLPSRGSCEPVAICTVGELFGGVERHVLEALSGLEAQGVSTLLVLFHDGKLAAEARKQGIEPIVLPGCNWSLPATARQLARILERRQVRIVHVHGYKATVFSALARHWFPFAMVKTEHGLPETLAGRPINTLRDRVYHLLDRVATRMAGATVCYVTMELQAHYRRTHLGLKVKVIPNGVANIDRHRLQRPPEFHEDWLNLAIVGRLDTVKGHHLAIEAAAMPGISPDLHLHIIGTGPCEADLRALAKDRGIADRVHFLGFRRNVYDYIAHSHALLMPSLHEGLPYTLLEALALGTPIIATRVGGLAEVMEHEVNALLVRPRDAKALAEAILRLHQDRDLCLRLSAEGRRLQQEKYSLKTMTERYLEVYRERLMAMEEVNL